MSYPSQVIIKNFSKATSKALVKMTVKTSSVATGIVASLFTTDTLAILSDIAVAQMGYSPYESYFNTAY